MLNLAIYVLLLPELLHGLHGCNAAAFACTAVLLLGAMFLSCAKAHIAVLTW